MRTREDIESFLMRVGMPYAEVEQDMWVVTDPSNGEQIVIRLAGPLVVFRTKIVALADIPDKHSLFMRLLELNAADMVHGAYGIAGDAIVMTCTLRLENLDYSEFQGTLDDFSLAITNHFEILSKIRKA